ncbi:DUF6134 family protein [Telmatospirillum sp.]|uniref:DUF6134 family protein n=1 Tax=Telmatospirillum sp. TaxID=2079197 RepID=UPI00284AF673|nr:DUF6134 family protein [Telmatospirillum sp.]MDR3438894.1 DUF6134 family protein [Telmatospirillum sp.]
MTVTTLSLRAAPAGVIAAFLLCCAGSPTRAADLSAVLDFSISRDGQPFGRHIIRIRRMGERTVVDNSANGDVMLGPFHLFTYDYACREIWEQDRLLSLVSRTDDDGRHIKVEAESGPGGLRVSGPDGDVLLPPETIPASFWTAAAVTSATLFDPRTGKVDHVQSTLLGDESDVVDNESLSIQHYKMTGDLVADLWYDRGGLLARARFQARGSVFDYVKTPQRAQFLADGHRPGGGT